MNILNTKPIANCNNAETLLPQFVDGELSARDAWQLEKHLANCRDCSLKVEQLKLTIDLLHDTARLDTNDDFMAKLHARLDDIDASASDTRTNAPRPSLREIITGYTRVLHVPGVPIGVAIGAVAVLMVALIPGLKTTPATQATAKPASHISTVVEAQLAQTAADPLGDAAADQLVVHPDSAVQDSYNP